MKSLTAISLILNAVLLLAARPYANSAWNESGSRNSGRLFPNALGGVCLSVAYTIYFFLCAQKDVTSYNSILGGGEVKGGDSIMIAGTEKPRLTPGMWVGLIMVGAGGSYLLGDELGAARTMKKFIQSGFLIDFATS